MSKRATRFSRDETIYNRPQELLQNLIRFDTTNPPGNEAECIAYINNLLTEAGLTTTLLAKDPNRPNLVTRLKGKGTATPLLFYGHVDVVTTSNQKWAHPPFERMIEDGYIWGRGALDMKGGVAMMLSAILRAKSEGIVPAGDIVLTILCDEEAFGNFGAKYLVENHAEVFEGINYAIGEFGGFSMYIGKQKFYPIMVSEKQICHMKATIRDHGGHGSQPQRGAAMAKLGKILLQLDEHCLPTHVTPVMVQMIEAMASNLTFPRNIILRQLLRPSLADGILKLLGNGGKSFEPLFHNTVSPTIVHGGEKINVIPSELVLELDGRLLPGYKPENIIAELRQIISDEVELEVILDEPGPAEPDMRWFDFLAGILHETDPEGKPIPMLISGTSDARFFSRLGIQTCGFLPMKLPKDFNFIQTIHAENERIPVEAVTFGTETIYKALQHYH